MLGKGEGGLTGGCGGEEGQLDPTTKARLGSEGSLLGCLTPTPTPFSLRGYQGPPMRKRSPGPTHRRHTPQPPPIPAAVTPPSPKRSPGPDAARARVARLTRPEKGQRVPARRIRANAQV